MQNFALTVADKQLIKTFFITFIAVVAGLPVASALMPSRQDALAHDTSKGVVKAAEDLGLGACGTGTGTGGGHVKSASSKHTHEVVTKHTHTHTNGNNNTNTGGAQATVRDAVVAVPIAVNDVVDVAVGDVSVPVLNNNQILSGNNGGGLLGIGLLGL